MTLSHEAGLGGLIAAMILIGLGQGGMTAVMVVFIGDQVPESKPTVVCIKDKLVVVDRKVTIQFVFNALFWLGNIAAIAELPTTLMEKHIDFWPAFLMPTCVMGFCVAALLICKKSLIKLPPQGNVLTEAFQVLLIACRSNFNLSAADPMNTAHNRKITWTSSFIHEIRRGLTACRIMICFTIFWLCYNQAGNNFVSQASQMRSGGISNDTLQVFNPIAVVIIVPMIQYLQNVLRRHKIAFGPVLRMTIAFMFTGVALAYAAGLQQLVYSRGPCFSHPLACSAALESGSSTSGEKQPNDISVWLQIPLYAILAIGETFGLVALYEYSFSEAPVNMKSLVQAIGQLTVALAAALGIALGPVSKDPYVIIMYGCLAGIIGVMGVLFWMVFRKYDKEYEKQEVLSATNLSTESESNDKDKSPG
ncbi:peptide transporter ptr2 [Paraconiothyrium brasiliense]|uniref:Peptide transporter ptr2 n=1 Tax=Paraconiothyrium brasiliense TaxID=300254 RepID=A0ABR3QWG2_9PLEO